MTGEIDVARPDNQTEKRTVIPEGASAALVNVTVVAPTDQGFLALRSGGAAGEPSTSTVNFQPLSVEPNAATVALNADGELQVYVFMPTPGASANVLIDIVGYTIDHHHDDRYYTKAQIDAGTADINANIAKKADATTVYNKGETYSRTQVLDLLDEQLADSGGIGAEYGDGVVSITDTLAPIQTLTVTAPVPGTVIVNGSFSIQIASGVGVDCAISNSPTAFFDGSGGLYQVLANGTTSLPWAETRAFDVAAGDTSFYILCQRLNGGDDPGACRRSLTAVFSPNEL